MTDGLELELGTAPTSGQSPRLTALRTLAGQLPTANSQIAAGQQATRDMQLQQAVAVAPVGTATNQAQQIGAQQGQEAGQQMVQRAQQGIAQASQIGQAGLQQEQLQNQAQIFGQQQGAQAQVMSNVERLANLSEQAKQELYDKQIHFQQDQNGRTLYTANQITDYAVVTAQNQQQYQAYAQQADQMNQRSLEATQKAYQLTVQDLNNKYLLAKQAGDEAQAEQIAQQKHVSDVAMQQAVARAKNNSAAWSAGGAVVGGVLGVEGGPAGVMAGAAAGSAIGTMAGNTVAAQQ